MSNELKLVCVYCNGQHATVDCPKWESAGELQQFIGFRNPDLKLADTHLDLAEIALRDAYDNRRMVGVVIGHLEDAIRALKGTP